MAIMVPTRTDDRVCLKCDRAFEYSTENDTWSCFCACYQGATHPFDREEKEDEATLQDVTLLLTEFNEIMDKIAAGVGELISRMDRLEKVVKEGNNGVPTK